MAKLDPSQLDPRNNLQFYTKAALRNSEVWTDSAIRAEYRRLRDIAQKRLKRLAEAEPGSYAYKTNKGKYPGARGMSTEQMRKALPDLARFIAARSGTVRGIKEQRTKALATLHAHGYTGINKSNLRAFGEFMEEWRSNKAAHKRGSPTAVETFEFTQKHNIPWETVKQDFAAWLTQRKKLESYVQKRHKSGAEVSADDLIAEFDRLEVQREKRKRARKK